MLAVSFTIVIIKRGYTSDRLALCNESTMSFIHLKGAYHSLSLSQKCQKYCGTSSYSGGSSYYYTNMSQGLKVTSTLRQSKINSIFAEMSCHKDFCLAIMDDLSILSKTKEAHFKHISIVLGVLKRFGLKFSPKKCHFFYSRSRISRFWNLYFFKII